MNLNEIAKQSAEIQRQRIKNGAKLSLDPVGILKHCSGEVVEATEAFIIHRYENNETTKKHFAEELSDIVLVVMSLSGLLEIDIEETVKEKLQKNWDRANLKGDKL